MDGERIKYYCTSCEDMEEIYLESKLITLYDAKCSTKHYHCIARCCKCGSDTISKDVCELNTNRYRHALEVLNTPESEWSKSKFNGYCVIMNMQCKSGCDLCYNKYDDSCVLTEDKLKQALADIGKMERVTLVGHNLLENEDTLKALKLIRSYVKHISMVTFSSISDYKKIKKLVAAGLDHLTLKFNDKLSCSKSLFDIVQYAKCIPKLTVELDCNVDQDVLETLIDNSINLVFKDRQLFDLSLQVLSEKNRTDYVLPVNINHTLYKHRALGNYSDLQFITNPTEYSYRDSDIYVTPIGNFSSWDKYCSALGL